MGNDGGSIPKRIELVKEKKKEVRPDQTALKIAIWFFCALSKVCITFNLMVLQNVCIVSSGFHDTHIRCAHFALKSLLQDPVVICALGKLYNKDAVLEFLLNREAYGDGDMICSHITSIKVFACFHTLLSRLRLQIACVIYQLLSIGCKNTDINTEPSIQRNTNFYACSVKSGNGVSFCLSYFNERNEWKV